MRDLCIDRLMSGGIITNYFCSSRCRHCLYSCSPRWPKDYMDSSMVQRAIEIIQRLGCRSVHIGGGEPFLDRNGLHDVVDRASREGMAIEYVETNSSWFSQPDSASAFLRSLSAGGLTTLLISMSPFHNEYIPFRKVKGVIEACRTAGLSVFPWISGFYKEIDSFADNESHSLEEYEAKFGAHYVSSLPSRYWVHFGGRALQTFAMLFTNTPVDELIAESGGGCPELADVSHFHVDLYGNYVPGLCSGLAIRIEDLGRPIDRAAYPFLSVLYGKGIGGLLQLATSEWGFQPDRHYRSKCHLCHHIRSFLVLDRKVSSPDLQPEYHYVATAAREVE